MAETAIVPFVEDLDDEFLVSTALGSNENNSGKPSKDNVGVKPAILMQGVGVDVPNDPKSMKKCPICFKWFHKFWFGNKLYCKTDNRSVEACFTLARNQRCLDELKKLEKDAKVDPQKASVFRGTIMKYETACPAQEHKQPRATDFQVLTVVRDVSHTMGVAVEDTTRMMTFSMWEEFAKTPTGGGYDLHGLKQKWKDTVWYESRLSS